MTEIEFQLKRIDHIRFKTDKNPTVLDVTETDMHKLFQEIQIDHRFPYKFTLEHLLKNGIQLFGVHFIVGRTR